MCWGYPFTHAANYHELSVRLFLTYGNTLLDKGEEWCLGRASRRHNIFVYSSSTMVDEATDLFVIMTLFVLISMLYVFERIQIIRERGVRHTQASRQEFVAAVLHVTEHTREKMSLGSNIQLG